jgi:hypothetical protein
VDHGWSKGAVLAPVGGWTRIAVGVWVVLF